MMQLPAATPAVAQDLSTRADGQAVVTAWQHANYQFTPQVKAAFLQQAKMAALEELKASGKSLPEDFLAWIDGDPVVAATVYGARGHAANVLRLLRSLELDLGRDVVRKDYTQLALALAVVHAAKGADADLTPREPLKLVISGDPRKLIDTKDPNRQLDADDHIINFLNEHTIEEDVVIGQREQPAPLKYDDKGIAIPPPKNAKPIKVPITEKRTRSLYAADVMASRAWQEKFNAYMKAHGHEVNIDCGDKVISWFSKEAVRAERKKINDAFVMFRTAYERKGLLPAARDPFPSPAECAAYLIRNDRYVFPAETKDQRKWPRYPLTAPWPTLTLLAADNQPLREREERWLAFRDKGEMRTYGEYIGPIAQQFDMQSARRLSPYPFHYQTYQMMAKDGGVCGTMANMGVRTQNSLGIPSCTAGQPGHCALIYFAFDPKTSTYECKGGQFATGGPDKTSPHTPWCFGDVDDKKPMVYYQTIGWAVNDGLQGYLDSTIAYQMFKALPDDARRAHGMQLLASGLAINPYNFLLADAALAHASTPQELIEFWQGFKSQFATITKPGCPKDSLYHQVVKNRLGDRLAKLPVPADPSSARAVLAFMDEEKCVHAEARVIYQIVINGQDAVVRNAGDDFTRHLASARTDESCQLMASTMSAVGNCITDKKKRHQWGQEKMTELAGHECFLGPKNKIVTDACLPVLAKLSGVKPAAENVLYQPVLDQVAAALKQSIAGTRDPKSCKQLADRITSVAGQIKDAALKSRWIDGLSQTIKGHQTYQPVKGPSQMDPCAQAIEKLLALPAAAKP